MLVIPRARYATKTSIFDDDVAEDVLVRQAAAQGDPEFDAATFLVQCRMPVSAAQVPPATDAHQPGAVGGLGTLPADGFDQAASDLSDHVVATDQVAQPDVAGTSQIHDPGVFWLVNLMLHSSDARIQARAAGSLICRCSQAGGKIFYLLQ